MLKSNFHVKQHSQKNSVSYFHKLKESQQKNSKKLLRRNSLRNRVSIFENKLKSVGFASPFKSVYHSFQQSEYKSISCYQKKQIKQKTVSLLLKQQKPFNLRSKLQDLEINHLSLEQLIRFYIKKCQFRNLKLTKQQGLRFINKVEGFSHNRQFNLQKFGICCFLMKQIKNLLKGSNQFIRLNLSRNFIGNKGAVQLVQLLKLNSSIISLKIPNNGISSKGFSHLFKYLKKNQTIYQLDISNVQYEYQNSIKNCKQFQEFFTHNSVLQILNISNIKMSEYDQMIERLQNRGLECLNISKNKLGKQFCKMFSQTMREVCIQELNFQGQ